MKKQKSGLSSAQKGNITRWFHDGLSISEISEKTGITPALVKKRIGATIRDDTLQLWSKVIRQVGRCEICGARFDLQAHHLLEKSVFQHLRYDLSNGICLCGSHHQFDRELSAHNNSASIEAFRLWLQRNRPGQYQWWDDNRLNRFNASKALSIDMIIEIYNALKAIYAKGLPNEQQRTERRRIEDIAQGSQTSIN